MKYYIANNDLPGPRIKVSFCKIEIQNNIMGRNFLTNYFCFLKFT